MSTNDKADPGPHHPDDPNDPHFPGDEDEHRTGDAKAAKNVDEDPPA